MNRPNVSAMDEIDSVLQDIQEMEEAISELKGRLHTLPAEIAQQVPEEERVITARYLYWFVPQVTSTDIAEGFFNVGAHELRNIIGAFQGDIVCDRCNQPIQFTSRSQAKHIIGASKSGRSHYAEGYGVLCKVCQDEVYAERHRGYQLSRQAQDTRLRELKSMPYPEYLRTPEWQARRKQHLKSAGYRCQVCNSSGVIIDVHHRTYERRGEEYYKDLIALCRECHSTFHNSRKLAG